LIPLGVHALHIRRVIPPLGVPYRRRICLRTAGAPDQHPTACPHGRTGANIPSGRADRRSYPGADDAAEDSPGRRLLTGDLSGDQPCLLLRKLPADGIVYLKLIERLAGSR
jgi:hypothetical protein